MQAIVGTENLNLKHKIRLISDNEADLIYFIHGRAGNYDVMWTFSRIVGERCNIITPEAPIAETVAEVNAKGFSWWLKNEGGSTLDEAKKASANLRAFMLEAEKAYSLKPKRRIAFGFSQGAGLISILIQEEPELLNAAALLAGFVLEVHPKTGSKLPNVFMAHGTKDEIVSLEKSERGAEYLRSLGYPIEYHTEEIGHKIGIKSMKLLGEWFRKFNP